MELFITIFAGLFSIINPLGTVPVFVGLTSDESKINRKKTCILTAINVCVILIIAFFAGSYVLNFFGISINSLRIAGGLIIASSGFALLTGSFTKHKGMKRSSVKADLETRSDISLTPLAIPMLAGPGSISLLITLNQLHKETNQVLIIIGAILSVGISVYLILRTSHVIVKGLGASGINAISRIIGFIVIAIGIEYVSTAVLDLIGKLIN